MRLPQLCVLKLPGLTASHPTCTRCFSIYRSILGKPRSINRRVTFLVNTRLRWGVAMPLPSVGLPVGTIELALRVWQVPRLKPFLPPRENRMSFVIWEWFINSVIPAWRRECCCYSRFSTTHRAIRGDWWSVFKWFTCYQFHAITDTNVFLAQLAHFSSSFIIGIALWLTWLTFCIYMIWYLHESMVSRCVGNTLFPWSDLTNKQKPISILHFAPAVLCVIFVIIYDIVLHDLYFWLRFRFVDLSTYFLQYNAVHWWLRFISE